MATDHNHGRDLLTPAREGEFQRIHGIGTGIAQRLHAAGVHTFHHLASLSPEEINALLNGLVGMTAERIANQEWPGKAHQLAEALAAMDPSSEPDEPAERQHYASFMVELLQDENYTVRRTRVVHVQNDVKDSWAGWDPGRLGTWITTQAAIPETPGPAMLEPDPVKAELPPSPRVAAYAPSASEIFYPGSDQPNRFLSAGQPFEIHLSFKAINETARPAPEPLRYRAAVFARPSGSQRLQIAEASGPCATAGSTGLVIPVDGLEEGMYRLETVVLIYPEDAAHPEKEGRSVISEGGRILVYSREAETTI